jgi:pimeloyl-ACP methyl ester carboxylesterase
VPVYEKATCPVLAIFGKYDFTLPIEESIERIEAALKVTGRQNHQSPQVDLRRVEATAPSYRFAGSFDGRRGRR